MQWEYKVINRTERREEYINDFLNHYGYEGWKLINIKNIPVQYAMDELPDGSKVRAYDYYYYFKRPKND